MGDIKCDEIFIPRSLSIAAGYLTLSLCNSVGFLSIDKIKWVFNLISHHLKQLDITNILILIENLFFSLLLFVLLLVKKF